MTQEERDDETEVVKALAEFKDWKQMETLQRRVHHIFQH